MRRARSIFVVVSFALVVVIPTTFAEATSRPCRVTDLRTKVVYEGTGANLQAAIDAAGRGTRLRVRGVCVGNFVIGRNLQLLGYPTTAYPTPTLDGNAAGTVLHVDQPDAIVVLRNLTITDGVASDETAHQGGGIRNVGTLTLQGVSVVGNSAVYAGGGVWNEGTITLNGSASVSGNAAMDSSGGGVYNATGTVILNDAAQVNGNTATDYAGGIANFGTIILNDAAQVNGNEGSFGGGIHNWYGIVILNDVAQVNGNTSSNYAGGIQNYGGSLTLTGAAQVNANTALAGGGGGIVNSAGGFTTLDGTSSVTGNMSSGDGGGIINFATLQACDGPSSFWTGAISPNEPDDPPPLTLITC